MKIDEIWAIYRRNLGQNSRWNINLPLKINFGRWIKNWEQSNHWIAILPLELHLGRQINTDVIWAVRSCCMKEGKYCQKISDISPIYHRYFSTRGDFFKKIFVISPRVDISPIFWRYLLKYLPSNFSPRNIVSTPFDTRYIVDISRHFPPWSQHDTYFLWKDHQLHGWMALVGTILYLFDLLHSKPSPTSKQCEKILDL